MMGTRIAEPFPCLVPREGALSWHQPPLLPTTEQSGDEIAGAPCPVGLVRRGELQKPIPPLTGRTTLVISRAMDYALGAHLVRQFAEGNRVAAMYYLP